MVPSIYEVLSTDLQLYCVPWLLFPPHAPQWPFQTSLLLKPTAFPFAPKPQQMTRPPISQSKQKSLKVNSGLLAIKPTESLLLPIII